MGDSRLARDVQWLHRHLKRQTEGQATVTEVDDNLQFIRLDITPTQGLFKGAKIHFKVYLDDYPDAAPNVVCCDDVFHPNIEPLDRERYSDDEEQDTSDTYVPDSNICVSLMNEWESTYDLDHLVMSLLWLLDNPNPEDALSPFFDGSCLEDEPGFKRNIRQALRGGEVEGRSWPRLLINDDDDDDEEEEEEGEAKCEDGDKVTGEANEGGENTGDGTNQEAEGQASEKTTDQAVEGSQRVNDQLVDKVKETAIIANGQVVDVMNEATDMANTTDTVAGDEINEASQKSEGSQSNKILDTSEKTFDFSAFVTEKSQSFNLAIVQRMFQRQSSSSVDPSDWGQRQTSSSVDPSDWDQRQTSSSVDPSDGGQCQTSSSVDPSDWDLSQRRSECDIRPALHRLQVKMCSVVHTLFTSLRTRDRQTVHTVGFNFSTDEGTEIN